MKCQVCDKYMAEYMVVINGEKVYACESCISTLMKKFTHSIPPNTSIPNPAMPRCPNCNLSLAEVVEHRMLGCMHCYNAFRPFLKKVLEKIHGKSSHNGKVPKEAILLKEIYDLEVEMKEAVEKEEYEIAAELRDKITEKRKELLELWNAGVAQ